MPISIYTVLRLKRINDPWECLGFHLDSNVGRTRMTSYNCDTHPILIGLVDTGFPLSLYLICIRDILYLSTSSDLCWGRDLSLFHCFTLH